MNENVKKWLRTGERGVSSETIVSIIEDIPIAKYYSHPFDVADWLRCERLLIMVPEYRSKLCKLSDLSEEWRLFVLAWDNIKKVFHDEEVGNKDGNCPKTYQVIKSVRNMARINRGQEPLFQ